MEKRLLYCWVARGLNVLVPKQRGEGFLKVPYGHHHDKSLTAIANNAHVDVFGLEGTLDFNCAGNIYHGGREVREEFSAKVIPALEAHYGLKAIEIDQFEFWAKHPLAAAVPQ